MLLVLGVGVSVVFSGGTHNGRRQVTTRSGDAIPKEESVQNDVVPAQKDTAILSSAQYVARMGTGIDVDWSKTKKGRDAYRTGTAQAFADRGFGHVRIRVKDAADAELFASLDTQVDECIAAGIMPVIAYQADAFKNTPDAAHRAQVVAWWQAVAARYADRSPLLAFDIVIEPTDALNRDSAPLNALYRDVIAAIRTTNPTRVVAVAPRLRSDPAYLTELDRDLFADGYVMAEWHFFAAGPSKTNARKQWTVGTDAEKKHIVDAIDTAHTWQRDTGVPTWVGAWMPGDYNDGDHYTVAEQQSFARFMTCSLRAAGIPFAVNSDTKFYDRDAGAWIPAMAPVLDVVLTSDCTTL